MCFQCCMLVFVLQACLLHLQLLKANKNIKIWINEVFLASVIHLLYNIILFTSRVSLPIN